MDFSVLMVLFIVGGLAAGLTSGLFGLGGGAVLVPLFLFLLPKIGASPEMAMHQAAGTSLAIIVPSAFTAAFKQYQLNNLDLAVLKTWIPFVLLGIVVASLGFKHISSIVLQVVFMVYLLLCAIYMLIKKPPQESQDRQALKIAPWSQSIAGTFVGALSIFLGIGGGTFIVPYYLANNFPFKKAIAISSATGFFIGVIGALSAMWVGFGYHGLAKYSIGYVNVMSWALIAPFSILAAVYGVKLNHCLKEYQLKILYVAFLFSIIAYVYVHTFHK